MSSANSVQGATVEQSTWYSSAAACVAALVLSFALAGVPSAARAQPVGSAAKASAPAGEAKWDRRDFNGMWYLTNFDQCGASTRETSAAQSAEDALEDWGFDTYPQLKGRYLQDYRQRREADERAGRSFLVTCKPNGMPALIAGPYGNEILQNEKQINWFQEFPGETWRIYLDGRAHPDPQEYPATLTGHSTGKWARDTLVVETVNIRTDTLLFGQGRSAEGLGHSEKMRIVTRMRLVDADHLRIDGTVEDPEALVKPWQFTLTYHRHPGEEVVEYLCDDNEQERVDPVTGQEITEIPARRNQPGSLP